MSCCVNMWLKKNKKFEFVVVWIWNKSYDNIIGEFLGMGLNEWMNILMDRWMNWSVKEGVL